MKTPEFYKMVQKMPREYGVIVNDRYNENIVEVAEYLIAPEFDLVLSSTRSAGMGYESSYMVEMTGLVQDYVIDVTGFKMTETYTGREVNLTNFQKEFIETVLQVSLYHDEENDEAF